MSEDRKEPYIAVYQYMRTELDLRGNELLTYAIINGFSRLENGKYDGTAQYIADWVGCTRRGTMKNLTSLVEKGLIRKRNIMTKGGRRCEYSVVPLEEIRTNQYELSSQPDVNNPTNQYELSSQPDVNEFHKGYAHSYQLDENYASKQRELSSYKNTREILEENTRGKFFARSDVDTSLTSQQQAPPPYVDFDYDTVYGYTPVEEEEIVFHNSDSWKNAPEYPPEPEEHIAALYEIELSYGLQADGTFLTEECTCNLPDDEPIGNRTASATEVQSNVDVQESFDFATKETALEKPTTKPKKKKAKSKNDLMAEINVPRGNWDKPFIGMPLNDGSEFEIWPSLVNEWKGLYPAVDVEQELRNMRGWSLGNPKKRKTKNGVGRFIVGWLAKEQDKPHPEIKPDKPKTFDDLLKIYEAEEAAEQGQSQQEETGGSNTQ